MSDIYGRGVIPIHQQIGPGKLKSLGSCVGLRILDFRVLTSAAHVLLEDNLWLPGKPQFVELEKAGKVYGTSGTLAEAKLDRKDVGYLVLKPKAIDALNDQGCEFLSVADTAFCKAMGKPEHLVVSGFPGTKSRNYIRGQISNARMDIAEESIPIEALVALGLDPKLHIAMRYDRSQVQRKGVRITGAMPHGMSGGAVWGIYDAGVPTLIAIATDYDKENKLIRGTLIKPLIFRIRDHLRTLVGINPITDLDLGRPLPS